MKTDMDEYAVNAVNRFKAEYGRKLHHVTSPYLTPEELAQISEEPGTFSASAASHVPTLLCLGRGARPDIVRSGATLVSRRNQVDDDTRCSSRPFAQLLIIGRAGCILF